MDGKVIPSIVSGPPHSSLVLATHLYTLWSKCLLSCKKTTRQQNHRTTGSNVSQFLATTAMFVLEISFWVPRRRFSGISAGLFQQTFIVFRCVSQKDFRCNNVRQSYSGVKLRCNGNIALLVEIRSPHLTRYCKLVVANLCANLFLFPVTPHCRINIS